MSPFCTGLRLLASGFKTIKIRNPSHEIDVIEVDELLHFVGSKKENYGFGLHLTDQGDVLLTLPLVTEAKISCINKGDCM